MPVDRPRGLLSCVNCRQPLQQAEGSLSCDACARTYPMVGGIPLLVDDAAGFLQRTWQALQADRRGTSARLADLDATWAQLGLPQAGLARQRLHAATALARLERVTEMLAPELEESRRFASQADGLGARSTGSGGWSLDALLGYFVRDWYADRELQAARPLIEQALAAAFEGRPASTLVFAGCGAGGLLASPQPRFGRVIGLDLSLPALWLDRALLTGASLTLPMVVGTDRGPVARDVTLQATTSSPGVELLLADACRMPLPDGSVDCVVTRFLLDVVPDPRAVAAEVHRILGPEGIWINYGPTGAPTGLWHFDEVEMAALLDESGFERLSTRQHRTTHLDCGQLDPLSAHQIHVCRLTVARRTARPLAPQASSRPAATAPTQPVEDRVPAHYAGAEFIQRRRLGEAQSDVLFMHERIRGYPERFEIGLNTERALSLVDGSRTVGEIARLLSLPPEGFAIPGTLQAFQRYVEQGLISWAPARRGGRDRAERAPGQAGHCAPPASGSHPG